MNWGSFNLAIADIESHMEGEGYTLNLLLAGGKWLLDYAHQTISKDMGLGGVHKVLVMSKPDNPPVYLCPSQIVYLELFA